MMSKADQTPQSATPAPQIWRNAAIGVVSVAAIIGGGIGIYRAQRPAELAAAVAEPPRPEMTPVVFDSAPPMVDASASAAAVVPAAPAGTSAGSGANAGAGAAPDPTPTPEPSPVVDDTITRMEERLAEKKDDVQGWRMLGWAYFQNERYKDAARALRKATALDPEHAETFSFLGEALVLANNHEGQMPRAARLAFDKALALDPKNPRARYFRALSLDLAGQHRRALRAWFAQLSETPPDAPYASDIRAVIRSVGKRHHIEVEKRLAIADAEARSPKVAKEAAHTKAAERRKGALPGPASAELKTASGPRQSGVASAASGAKDAMARGMVDGLEARLARNPANVDGWILLIRSRVHQNEPARARKALAEGLAAFRTRPAEAAKLRDAAARLGVSEN
ncbi:tetratricopeptide repeat protein [Novosphingobium pituita]|nr:tetratricopeptide repeat protein [Novosphingobium sp. IK01]